MVDNVLLQDLGLNIKATISKTDMFYIPKSVWEENIAISSVVSHVGLAEYKSDNEVGTTLESKDLPFSRGSPLNSTSCNLVLWPSTFESVKMNSNLKLETV